MFLNKLKIFFRQVGVKMTLWHLFFLLISSTFLFFIFYYLFAQSLGNKDHEILEARFKEYNAIYSLGGTTALEKFFRSPDLSFSDSAAFFVRIENSDFSTTFFKSEGKNSIFNLKEIEYALYDHSEKKRWFYIKTKRKEDDLEVLSLKMKNGEFLQVGKTVADRDELLSHFEKTFAEVLLIALALGGVGGVLLANRFLRPLRGLITTLQSISKGDEEARVPATGSNDELEELSRLFNQMLDHVKTSNQGMRQTLDTVAHELRTPLTSIRGLAEVNLHKKNITDKDAREAFEDCIEGIDEILSEFKMMTDITEVESGLQNLKKENVDLLSVCQDIIDLYEIVADQKDITIALDEKSQDERITIFADRKKIRQALANLVDNAIKYSPEESDILVSFYKHNSHAVIRISDNGIGIHEEDLPHIWKRLYRGENSRGEKGIGLGLSLVKSIVEAHNGTISVETTPHKGSTFIIRIPV
jgi:signal transduction histidine kinase